MGNGYLSAPPSEIYTGLRAVNVQNYTESNVKLGLQHGLTVELSLTAGQTKYLTFKTPAVDNVILKTRFITTDGGMRYRPRKNVVVTNDGLVQPSTNFNGQSANVAGSVVRLGPSVITNAGVPFDIVRSANGQGGQKEPGVFAGDGLERVLAKDTTYLLEFENTDNITIYIIYSITWYEGVLDLPRP